MYCPTQGSVINSNKEWAQVCSGSGASTSSSWFTLPSSENAANRFTDATMGMAVLFFFMLFAWLGSFAIKRYKKRNYIRLHGEEVSLMRLQRLKLTLMSGSSLF